MAIAVQTGSFVGPLGTGNQAVTGVGFTPQLVIMHTGPPGAGPHNLFMQSWGAFASEGTPSQFAVGGAVQADGNTTTNTSRGQPAIDAACVHQIDPDWAVQNVASYVSMDADGFTINWTQADLLSQDIYYIAFSGFDNVAARGFTTTTNFSQNLGFQPDAIMTFHMGQPAPTAGTGARVIGHGMAAGPTGSSVQGCVSVRTADAWSSTINCNAALNTRCAWTAHPSNAAVAERVSYSGSTATGWDGTTDNANNRVMGYVAFKGGVWDLTQLNVPATPSVVTRTKSETPRATFLMCLHSSVTLGELRTSDADLSFGWATPSDQRCFAFQNSQAVATPDDTHEVRSDRVLNGMHPNRLCVASAENWGATSYDLNFTTVTAESYYWELSVSEDQAGPPPADLAGDLAVSGALVGNLTANNPGIEALAGDLTVAGVLAGDVTVIEPPPADLAGDLTVSGLLAADLTVTPLASLDGNLAVAGFLSGNVTVEAPGEVQLSGDLRVAGTLWGQLLVMVTQDLSGDLSVSGTLFGQLKRQTRAGGIANHPQIFYQITAMEVPSQMANIYAVFTNTDVTVLGRITDTEGVPFVTSDISGISWAIYNHTNDDELIATGILSPQDTIYDELQMDAPGATDPVWSTDSIGYNFKWSFPAAHFTVDDNWYEISIEFSDAQGGQTAGTWRFRTIHRPAVP